MSDESQRPDEADVAPDEDELDAMMGDSAGDAREWFRKQVRTRGLRSAFAALVGVCEDPKAPAPARATAGVALLRAGGAFSKAEEDRDGGKPVDQMSAAELDRELLRVRAMTRRAERTLKRAEEQEQHDRENDGGALD